MRICGAVLALLAGALGPPAAWAAEAVAVEASPIALNPRDPSQSGVGSLRWRGGLQLRSADRRFGGLSDLVVSPDGARLTAISDQGSFLTARLVYDARGFLSGVADAALSPLLDPQGRPLEGKRSQDAESLAKLRDGSFVVGFERWHRIWRYAPGLGGPAQPLAPPKGLERAPDNSGIETLVALSEDRLLALTEETAKKGVAEGWLRVGGRWKPIAYRLDGRLRPSGGCRLPSGDVALVERRYEPAAGVTARIRRVPAASVVPGAVMEGAVVATLARPLAVDNFEGLACRAGTGAETLLYLLSDDNFSADQRTLLLMFSLP